MTNFVALLLSTSVLLGNGGMNGFGAQFSTECEDQRKVAITGTVHGGQAPVAFAHVHVLAAGHSGYGESSRSVLREFEREDEWGGYVLSDDVGDFKIHERRLHCKEGEMIYVLATGGNAGVGHNAATGLMAPIGPCPKADATTQVWVNEVSTVAMAYALAAYASDPAHISSSSSTFARNSMVNSFALATNLYDSASGVALAKTPAGNGEAPQATINTLANVLAACVNTHHRDSPACTALFSAADVKQDASQGEHRRRDEFRELCERRRREHGIADTATAAINIAHNPSMNVDALFDLQSGGGTPFQPALPTAPTTFVLAVAYTGGGLNTPLGMAVDGAGNVWAGNKASGVISAFNPLGVPLSAAGYDSGAQGTAYTLKIDAANNVWIQSTLDEAMYEMTSAGVPVPVPGFGSVVWQKPLGMAFDSQSHLWLGDDNGVTEETPQGQLLNRIAEPSSEQDGVGDVAVDMLGNVWATNFDDNLLVKLSGAGVPYLGTGVGGPLDVPQGIAIDSQNNVWVANLGGSLGKFANDGTPVSPSGFIGGGLAQNRFLAIDGADHVWSASNIKGVVSEFDALGVPVAPAGFVVKPGGTGFWTLAIDGSGNVWLSSADNSMVQLVGAAAPVVTPLVTATTTGKLGVRP